MDTRERGRSEREEYDDYLKNYGDMSLMPRRSYESTLEATRKVRRARELRDEVLKEEQRQREEVAKEELEKFRKDLLRRKTGYLYEGPSFANERSKSRRELELEREMEDMRLDFTGQLDNCEERLRKVEEKLLYEERELPSRFSRQGKIPARNEEEELLGMLDKL